MINIDKISTKKGVYDISEIDFSQIFVEGSLSVRVEKLSTFLFFFISTILTLTLFVLVLYSGEYFKIAIFFIICVFTFKYSLGLYLLALNPTPYIFIDQSGIVFKNNTYLWNEIETIKFERRLSTNNWEKLIHIVLKSQEKVTIELISISLNQDTRTIVAYINKYRNKG